MRRMRLLVLASIVAITFGACSDQQSPVEPDAEGLAGKKAPVNCLSDEQQAIADSIRADIPKLFPGKKGPNAPTEHLNNITRKLCEGHYADALDMAWGFLALVNEKNPDNFSGSAADAAELTSAVFALVAATPNPAPSPFEIPPGAFDETGGIIVFDPDLVTLPFVAGTRNGEAAVVVDAPNIFPPGTGLVTVVLSRDPGSVVTPFGAYIPGFQAFEEGYEILSSHQPWSEGPGILVALCGVPPLPSDAAIGHLHETGVSLLVATVPDPQTLGYIDCSDVDPFPFGGGGTFLSMDDSMDDGPAWTQVARRVVRPVADFLSPPLLQAEAVALAAAGRGLGGRTQSLSLNAPVDPVIDVDEEIQLSVGTDATWTSDDTDIATVDSDGLVTGEGAGTATITADFTGISGPETLTIVITVEGDGEVLNGLIVFTSERDNGNAEVYVMDADGGNQTNLTNDNFASDREPTWSPFGTQIAFVSDRTESDRIHTMNADGFNVSFALGASGASWPAWSPDGQQIAYLVDGAVHVMDSDGDNDVELPTSLSFAEAGLDWSPDGTQIVASDNGSIVIFNSDGTGSPSEVTSGSFDIYPAWSPDGDQIAFMRSDGEGPGDLYVYTFSLESESNLTTGSGSSDDGQPAWSPGGLKIVFWSNRTEDDRIWVMDADGSAQSQITTGGQDVDPEPQPPVSIID